MLKRVKLFSSSIETLHSINLINSNFNFIFDSKKNLNLYWFERSQYNLNVFPNFLQQTGLILFFIYILKVKTYMYLIENANSPSSQTLYSF